MSRRKKMGEVYADLTVRGPRGEEELRHLLVDTGSSYTWIPAVVARRLGVRPMFVLAFELGGGRVARRRVGEAEVEIVGRRGTRFVVFARPGEPPVVGHDTLQGLLLHVDMTRDQLMPGRPLRAPLRRAIDFVPSRRARRAVRAERT